MSDICDITAKVKAASGELEIWLNNYCEYFEQEIGRMFSHRECWYCKYGEFGIYTEHPTKNGVCRYKHAMNGTPNSLAKRCTRNLNEKQEEETR